jgi:hypothetical protein
MSLPVLRLRVAGFWSSVTSCASSEEEKLYGQAACELQSIPIVWYRKVKPKVNTKCSSAVDVVNSKSSAGTVEAPESRSPHQDTQDSNDSSIPFFLKRQMTFLRNSTTATGTADGKSDSNTSGINSNGSSDAGSSETYARFDGVLSLCDTESGPAIELRSTSKDVQQILETHDFSDFDQKLDAIVSNLFQGKATGYAEDDVGADAGKEGAFAAIERIIPLDIIDYAAQGGAWDWSNMLNVGSGQLDCGIKVYSCKSTI